MKIAVLKERRPDETRVAASPDTVKKLTQLGATVSVEEGAGDAAAFSEKGLEFAVKMTAPAAGEYTIPATLKFAVCTDATCDPKKEKVALVLKAN